MKNILHGILSFLSGFALIIILFFTSIQAIIFWFPGYFQYEYQKYHITETVGINMDDLLKVTEEMLAYLEGNRSSLADIKTTIHGKEDIPFFNQREIAHMVDVQTLFISARNLRNFLLIFFILSIMMIYFTKGELPKVLANGILQSIILFLLFFILLAFIIFQDFSSAFIQFHHLFFHNDLWLLDPATDNLINIVPEGFFFDTARNILIVFLSGLILLTVLTIWLKKSFHPDINT